ncbi:hypothetical protein AAHA92_15237 [Salvia divinorum]|uniref:Uncharacterized protein n=1 Tax=Salvia divinorum TaxID=28513 RepID=A0ABD1HE30_SALDI
MEEQSEIEERRYQAERKRKGKQVARPPLKKVKKAKPVVSIREPVTESTPETPDMVAVEKEAEGSEKDEDSEEESPHIGYENLVVELDEDLLQRMENFDDPKQQSNCSCHALNLGSSLQVREFWYWDWLLPDFGREVSGKVNTHGFGKFKVLMVYSWLGQL